MGILNTKIDFAAILSVVNANPNGDPLTGNQPRVTYAGVGEISDVCIKRKLRNRLMDAGCPIFVQSDDRAADGFKSLKERAESVPELKKEKDRDKFAQIACEKWLDVRAFGQVFAFKGDEVSVGVRGPVSVHPAFSVEPVTVVSTQITKSVNSVPGPKKGSDTMEMKHRVERGVYVAYGSVNCQLAEKTGFTEADAEEIRKALCTLFENDASSARPDGSMAVREVFWWRHNCKSGQYSSAKVHGSITVKPSDEAPFYTVERHDLDGLTPEVYEGI